MKKDWTEFQKLILNLWTEKEDEIFFYNIFIS